MPTPEQVRSVLDNYATTISKQDRDGWLACFAEDATQVDPVGAPANLGREAIGTFWDNVISQADSIDFTFLSTHVCGDRVAAPFNINVRSGDGGMVIAGVDLFTVNDDGLIAAMEAFWGGDDIRAL